MITKDINNSSTHASIDNDSLSLLRLSIDTNATDLNGNFNLVDAGTPSRDGGGLVERDPDKLYNKNPDSRMRGNLEKSIDEIREDSKKEPIFDDPEDKLYNRFSDFADNFKLSNKNPDSKIYIDKRNINEQ